MASLDEKAIQLSDGTVLYPDDSVRVADLWEIMPLIIESLGAQAAGGLAPGQQLPIAGMPGAPAAPGVPGAMARPGAIPGLGGPTAGPASLGGGGRGTGFSGIGGGGGRGARGQQGPAGPPGPPGPGRIVPVVKTDGNFTLASVSPFVPVPDTKVDFQQGAEGAVLFLIQAIFGGNSVDGMSNGQLGLRIDGVDQPLTANLIHTGAAGVGQFLASVHTSFPKVLAAGSHSVEIVLRGDSSLGAPTGEPVELQANPNIPLALTVIHQ